MTQLELSFMLPHSVNVLTSGLDLTSLALISEVWLFFFLPVHRRSHRTPYAGVIDPYAGVIDSHTGVVNSHAGVIVSHRDSHTGVVDFIAGFIDFGA